MANDRWREDERQRWGEERSGRGRDYGRESDAGRNLSPRSYGAYRGLDYAEPDQDRYGSASESGSGGYGRDRDYGYGYGASGSEPSRYPGADRRAGYEEDWRRAGEGRSGRNFGPGGGSDYGSQGSSRYGAGYGGRQDFGSARGDRDAWGYDRSRGYRGAGFTDWQGERGSRDFSGYGGGSDDYRGSEGYRSANDWRGSSQDRDRGWWERTKDEVRSWMGDEEADRRRRMDSYQDYAREPFERGHYGRGPRGYSRSDQRILEDVNDRLTEDWHVDASEIDVSVVGGEVTLSGTVDSRETKRRAENIAAEVTGVKDVQNNIRVRQRYQNTTLTGSSSAALESTTGLSSAPNAAGTGASGLGSTTGTGTGTTGLGAGGATTGGVSTAGSTSGRTPGTTGNDRPKH